MKEWVRLFSDVVTKAIPWGRNSPNPPNEIPLDDKQQPKHEIVTVINDSSINSTKHEEKTVENPVKQKHFPSEPKLSNTPVSDSNSSPKISQDFQKTEPSLTTTISKVEPKQTQENKQFGDETKIEKHLTPKPVESDFIKSNDNHTKNTYEEKSLNDKIKSDIPTERIDNTKHDNSEEWHEVSRGRGKGKGRSSTPVSPDKPNGRGRAISLDNNKSSNNAVRDSSSNKSLNRKGSWGPRPLSQSLLADNPFVSNESVPLKKKNSDRKSFVSGQDHADTGSSSSLSTSLNEPRLQKAKGPSTTNRPGNQQVSGTTKKTEQAGGKKTSTLKNDDLQIEPKGKTPAPVPEALKDILAQNSDDSKKESDKNIAQTTKTNSRTKSPPSKDVSFKNYINSSVKTGNKTGVITSDLKQETSQNETVETNTSLKNDTNKSDSFKEDSEVNCAKSLKIEENYNKKSIKHKDPSQKIVKNEKCATDEISSKNECEEDKMKLNENTNNLEDSKIDSDESLQCRGRRPTPEGEETKSSIRPDETSEEKKALEQREVEELKLIMSDIFEHQRKIAKLQKIQDKRQYEKTLTSKDELVSIDDAININDKDLDNVGNQNKDKEDEDVVKKRKKKKKKRKENESEEIPSIPSLQTEIIEETKAYGNKTESENEIPRRDSVASFFQEHDGNISEYCHADDESEIHEDVKRKRKDHKAMSEAYELMMNSSKSTTKRRQRKNSEKDNAEKHSENDIKLNQNSVMKLDNESHEIDDQQCRLFDQYAEIPKKSKANKHSKVTKVKKEATKSNCKEKPESLKESGNDLKVSDRTEHIDDQVTKKDDYLLNIIETLARVAMETDIPEDKEKLECLNESKIESKTIEKKDHEGAQSVQTDDNYFVNIMETLTKESQIENNSLSPKIPKKVRRQRTTSESKEKNNSKPLEKNETESVTISIKKGTNKGEGVDSDLKTQTVENYSKPLENIKSESISLPKNKSTNKNEVQVESKSKTQTIENDDKSLEKNEMKTVSLSKNSSTNKDGGGHDRELKTQEVENDSKLLEKKEEEPISLSENKEGGIESELKTLKVEEEHESNTLQKSDEATNSSEKKQSEMSAEEKKKQEEESIKQELLKIEQALLEEQIRNADAKTEIMMFAMSGMRATEAQNAALRHQSERKAAQESCINPVRRRRRRVKETTEDDENSEINEIIEKRRRRKMQRQSQEMKQDQVRGLFRLLNYYHFLWYKVYYFYDNHTFTLKA